MSHFSSIGYRIDSPDELDQLSDSLKAKSTKKEFGKYTQYVADDESGSQLFWHTEKSFPFGKEQGLGMTPAFKGKCIQKIKEAHFRPDVPYKFEPLLFVWVYDDDGSEYPLAVDLLNDLEIKDKDVDSFEVMQATLFAEEIEFFPNEDAFWKKYPKKEKISFPSPGMFIPTGTFSPKDDPEYKPHAACWCYGEVISSERLVNKFTDISFWHLVMKTYAASYDIVADINMFDAQPKKGGIVGGKFWICARVSH